MVKMPEFVIDIRQKGNKSLVRIFDTTNGEIIFTREVDLWTGDVVHMIERKLREVM